MLDRVLELPDVAGPVVSLQMETRVLVDRLYPLAGPLRALAQEEVDQHRYVIPWLPQWGNLARNDVQAVI